MEEHDSNTAQKKDAAEPASTADDLEAKQLSEQKQQDKDARREAKIRRKLTRDWTAEERCFVFRLARRREMDSYPPYIEGYRG